MFHELRPGFHEQGVDWQGGESRVPTVLGIRRGIQLRDRSLLFGFCVLTTSLRSQGTCVQNCTDKFLKHSERVGARFAEHNAGTLSPCCLRDYQLTLSRLTEQMQGR